MNRALKVVVLTGLMFVGRQAHSVDSTNQPTMSKRRAVVQMVDCMKKQMSANKSRLYNETVKACKAQINTESDDLPSGALVASDTPAKP
jgi:hypothetical protein